MSFQTSGGHPRIGQNRLFAGHFSTFRGNLIEGFFCVLFTFKKFIILRPQTYRHGKGLSRSWLNFLINFLNKKTANSRALVSHSKLSGRGFIPPFFRKKIQSSFHLWSLGKFRGLAVTMRLKIMVISSLHTQKMRICVLRAKIVFFFVEKICGNRVFFRLVMFVIRHLYVYMGYNIDWVIGRPQSSD